MDLTHPSALEEQVGSRQHPPVDPMCLLAVRVGLRARKPRSGWPRVIAGTVTVWTAAMEGSVAILFAVGPGRIHPNRVGHRERIDGGSNVSGAVVAGASTAMPRRRWQSHDQADVAAERLGASRGNCLMRVVGGILGHLRPSQRPRRCGLAENARSIPPLGGTTPLLVAGCHLWTPHRWHVRFICDGQM
jgi:hypothetical protein